jgi:hypothetical protein
VGAGCNTDLYKLVTWIRPFKSEWEKQIGSRSCHRGRVFTVEERPQEAIGTVWIVAY